MDDVTGTAAFLTSLKVMGACRKIKDGDDHVIPVSKRFHGIRGRPFAPGIHFLRPFVTLSGIRRSPRR